MVTDFHRRLDALIHERCGSSSRFCEAVEKARGSLSESYLSRILRGERPVPLEEVARWARALKLKPEESEAFFILAELATLPNGDDSHCGRSLRMLSDRVQALRAEVDELTIRVDTLTNLHRPSRDGRA